MGRWMLHETDHEKLPGTAVETLSPMQLRFNVLLPPDNNFLPMLF